MESKVLPKVSIIVPVYKTEAYIAECLDSVLAQTYQDFEVICVDDGSPDNSVEIIKEYSKNDPRISYVRQENAGLSAARNTGIRNAKGEYILPLDSDDMLEKKPSRISDIQEKIEKIINYLIGNDVNLISIYGAGEICDELYTDFFISLSESKVRCAYE